MFIHIELLTDITSLGFKVPLKLASFVSSSWTFPSPISRYSSRFSNENIPKVILTLKLLDVSKVIICHFKQSSKLDKVLTKSCDEIVRLPFPCIDFLPKSETYSKKPISPMGKSGPVFKSILMNRENNIFKQNWQWKFVKIRTKNKGGMHVWGFADLNTIFLETSIRIMELGSWCHSLTTLHMFWKWNF